MNELLNNNHEENKIIIEPIQGKSTEIENSEKINEQISEEYKKLDKNMQRGYDQIEKMGGWQELERKMNYAQMDIEQGKIGLKISATLFLVLGAMGCVIESLQPGEFSEVFIQSQKLLSGIVNSDTITEGIGGAGLTALIGSTAAVGIMGVPNTVRGFFEKRKLKRLESKALGTEPDSMLLSIADTI